ncbi:chain length determinant protein tyrosine kinase EpsG [Uliginosibacterium sp. H3]|uniref:Chain length determinant protein tyrosine kinase EpsG n=1 Tax=Uliginosibacterium silvisoli TaxID=3114758 RepID=A0ABU6JZY8_9RHOO|nr:chain length determinant protein tyrosine kinase EpsG [Uliginosibacterium sp. H3]
MNAPRILTSAQSSIGAILIDAGRLRPDDAERILRLQREQNLRFGDAAIQLGILTDADVKFALSRQFDYSYLVRGDSSVAEEVIAAYNPFSPQVEALKALRTQLMIRWFDRAPERKSLSIVSPEVGEGRSWLAANLAVVFSQLGERTLLIDADLRSPKQHSLFSLENTTGLSAVLVGRAGNECIQKVPQLRDLSVMTSGGLPPNPSELLSRQVFADLLWGLASEYDVILLDTPSATTYPDAQSIAARTGGALMLAQKNITRASKLRAVSDSLGQCGAVIVGTAMTDH